MSKKVPLRQCVGCGQMKSKKEMMRVIKTAEGDIVLDVTGRKNGRGAYLCKQEECLKMAMKNKGLERSFKRSMTKTVKNKKKIFSLIGLATRARKTVSGEFATEKAVKSFKACLVIVAEDASDNTKKLFQDKCSFYEVPCYVCGTKEELAHAMGKEVRASLAVTDEGFADAIINLLN